MTPMRSRRISHSCFSDVERKPKTTPYLCKLGRAANEKARKLGWIV